MPQATSQGAAAACDKVNDKDDQRNNQQKMDQTAGDVKTKT
jgi:hypothetical protein